MLKNLFFPSLLFASLFFSSCCCCRCGWMPCRKAYQKRAFEKRGASPKVIEHVWTFFCWIWIALLPFRVHNSVFFFFFLAALLCTIFIWKTRRIRRFFSSLRLLAHSNSTLNEREWVFVLIFRKLMLNGRVIISLNCRALPQIFFTSHFATRTCRVSGECRAFFVLRYLSPLELDIDWWNSSQLCPTVWNSRHRKKIPTSCNCWVLPEISALAGQNTTSRRRCRRTAVDVHPSQQCCH